MVRFTINNIKPGVDVFRAETQAVQWGVAQWMLAIWNPDLMNFIRDDKRRRNRRLYYRAKGVVVHDQALNGRLFTSGAAQGS